MNNTQILYRGFSSEKAFFIRDYVNLTDNRDFASEYGNIILVYEYERNHILEEKISDRKNDVREYDTMIDWREIDGYRWKISKKWIYHYRMKSSSLKLVKVLYPSEELADTVSILTRFNRKYLELNQAEFSKRTWIPRVKVSEYENAQRIPSFEKISLLTSLVDIPQEIDMWKTKVVFSQ